MESYLQDIFGWLPIGGSYYLLIGLVSLLESMALIGIFVPGSVLIIFAGFLAAHGRGDYVWLFTAATAGAILGDILSYWLGARLGSALRFRPIFQKHTKTLRKAEIFFHNHGGKSVLFGRFVGFLRPFIPFVAGSSQMRPGPFASFALVSGILWGLAYPGLGYLFAESWKQVELWSGRLSLLIGVLLVLVVVCSLAWRKLGSRTGKCPPSS